MAISYVYTFGGWVAIIGIGYIYYRSHMKAGRRTKLSAKAIENKARAASVGEKTGKFTEKAAPTKKKAKKISTPGPEPAWATTEVESDHEEEINNREFARQFSEKKSGTLLQAKSQVGAARQKSVKQSKAQEKQAAAQSSPDTTAPSSATGGDADDDQSSINSPELGATSDDTPVTNGGISDMLEAPAPGPSVLRVIAPVNPTQPKKPKVQASFEVAETKKQRQNRKKAEQKKLEREAEEREQKKKGEQQRRTAREAGGRAAKDGSLFMASQAPSSSAWAAGTNGQENAKPVSQQTNLLDTFDAPVKKAARRVDDSESAAEEWEKVLATLPSEEEQQRLALEESSENWEEVKGKKKKKPTKTQADVDELVLKNALKEEDLKFYADNKSPTPQPLGRPSVPGAEWEMTLDRFKDDGTKESYVHDTKDTEWEV